MSEGTVRLPPWPAALFANTKKLIEHSSRLYVEPLDVAIPAAANVYPTFLCMHPLVLYRPTFLDTRGPFMPHANVRAAIAIALTLLVCAWLASLASAQVGVNNFHDVASH